MPVFTIQAVAAEPSHWPAQPARALADALGTVYGAGPGRVWVRFQRLPAADYAENGVPAGATPSPVFVAVLQADRPAPAALAAEAAAVAAAVAGCLGCDAAHVHVEFMPPARGRMAFGGVLLEG